MVEQRFAQLSEKIINMSLGVFKTGFDLAVRILADNPSAVQLLQDAWQKVITTEQIVTLLNDPADEMVQSILPVIETLNGKSPTFKIMENYQDIIAKIPQDISPQTREAMIEMISKGTVSAPPYFEFRELTGHIVGGIL